MKHAYLMIFATLPVLFSSCGGGKAEDADREGAADVYVGGTLRVTVQERPESLAPFSLNKAAETRLAGQVHAGLLRLNTDQLKAIPSIAESYSASDDGTVYVFNLRKDVLFHDSPCLSGMGREVTARDFVYSFTKLCAPGSAAFESTFKGRVLGAFEYNLGETPSVSGIEALDDYTLRITLARPDGSFPFILAQPATGVFSMKAFESCNGRVIGAGPFMLKETDDKLRLVRNEDYFVVDAFNNRLPYVDTVEVFIHPERDGALEALFNREIDLVTSITETTIKRLMEEKSSLLTGADPEFVMQRPEDADDLHIYSLHHRDLRGFRDNSLSHRDYSVIQLARSNGKKKRK